MMKVSSDAQLLAIAKVLNVPAEVIARWQYHVDHPECNSCDGYDVDKSEVELYIRSGLDSLGLGSNHY